jgi:hypothetical protein
VRPLLGLCLDDAFYFVTRERTRKGMNLAGTPAVVSLPAIAGSEERGTGAFRPTLTVRGRRRPESTIGCPAGT